MLIETHGGFDYPGADCMGWIKEAGFRETRVELLVGPDSMVSASNSKKIPRGAIDNGPAEPERKNQAPQSLKRQIHPRSRAPLGTTAIAITVRTPVSDTNPFPCPQA